MIRRQQSSPNIGLNWNLDRSPDGDWETARQPISIHQIPVFPKGQTEDKGITKEDEGIAELRDCRQRIPSDTSRWKSQVQHGVSAFEVDF